MAWDKSKPPTGGDLLSAEIRANWDALDAALMAPLAAAAAGSVFYVSAGHVFVVAPSAAEGFVLKYVSGVPTWAAAASGAAGVERLPIEQATLPDGTGSTNAPPTMIREISTGQTANTPKRARTYAKFSAGQALCWGFQMPANYGSGGTIRGKYKTATVNTGTVIWSAGQGSVTDGATDDDALVYVAEDVTAALTVPAAQGQVQEFTIPLTMTGAAAGRAFSVFVGRKGGTIAAQEAILMSCRFEYTPA